MAMTNIGELRNLGAPRSSDVGKPLQKPRALAKVGDNVRGTVLETPILTVALAILYDKAVVKGNPNRNWGFWDIIFVIALAQFVKRVGVGRRINGVLPEW